MPDPAIWTFTQLGGDRTVRTLGGWSAPFGRRRQKTLVNAGLKIRCATTYYQGKVEPTVHVFGTAPKPWDLSGRFMDSALALSGGALAYRRQWYDFVNAAQIVRATWGNYLSYRIFIEEMDLEIESATDVAWHIHALVFADEASVITITDEPTQSPIDLASIIQAEMAQFDAVDPGSLSLNQTVRQVLNLLPEISDTLDTAIAAINEPFATVFDICSAISDFETAISSDLGKLGAGAAAMQAGIIDLRDTTELLLQRASQLNIPTADQAAGMFSGPDMIALTTQKIATDAASTNLLRLLADMRNQIDFATRGNVGSAHVAQATDTWDSMARRTLGGADGARAIRGMNGVRYGQRPVPGKTYTIPKTA